MDLLAFDFMRRALVAGALVGLAAPAVGIFLVQRRLSLMGDGIGHVVFMGVAAGLLLGVAPLATALAFALVGGTAIELLRQRGKMAGDVALALVFYTGIAGGALLLGLADSSTVALNAWLFGSVLTVEDADLWIMAVVAAVAVGAMLVLRARLFAIAYDEEVARASGLRVASLNLVVAALAAIVVAVTAKIVGILLVSALLVLPVAAAQQVAGSFRATFYLGLAAGVAVTVVGLTVSFYVPDALPSATIVLVAMALFVAATVVRRVRAAG